MNPTRILSISAVALLATTMIVACGPKDRTGGVPVSKIDHSGNPNTPGGAAKPAATPTNATAQSELKEMLGNPGRLADAKKIMSSIKDLTLTVDSNNIVRIRVTRNSTLSASTPGASQSFIFTNDGMTASNSAPSLVLKATGSTAAAATATTEVSLYAGSNGGLDSIKIRDLSDSTKNKSFVIYTMSTIPVTVTPVDVKAMNAAITAANTAGDSALASNLTKVSNAFSAAEGNSKPFISEFVFRIDQDNKSFFQTIVIPAAPKSGTAASTSFDSSNVLIAVSTELIKGGTIGDATSMINNAESGDAGLQIPDVLNVPLVLTGSPSASGKNAHEMDLNLKIESKVGGTSADWKLHVARVADAAKIQGSLSQFSATAAGGTVAPIPASPKAVTSETPAAMTAPATTATPPVTVTPPAPVNPAVAAVIANAAKKSAPVDAGVAPTVTDPLRETPLEQLPLSTHEYTP